MDDNGASSNVVATVGTVTQGPAIVSLTDSPDPVQQGNLITLRTKGVTDSDGTVSLAEFFCDDNNDVVG